MFGREKKKTYTEEFFNKIIHSLETEPEQWYISKGKVNGHKDVRYKKAPNMRFDLDPHDGEFRPEEPEHIRPRNAAENRAYEKLKDVAKKNFVNNINNNSAKMMLLMFEGFEYDLIPVPEIMTPHMVNALSRMSGNVFHCKNYIWFSKPEDAAYFKLLKDDDNNEVDTEA